MASGGNSQYLINDVVTLVKDIFGLESHLSKNASGESISILVCNAILPRLFFKLFGKGAREKRIFKPFLFLPKEKQLELIKGLFRGDGCYYRKQERIQLTLASKKLIEQTLWILHRLEHKFTIKQVMDKPYWTLSTTSNNVGELVEQIYSKKIKMKRQQREFIEVDGKILYRITSIENSFYDGSIHNLEVENAHTYVVNGVCVHNCLMNAGRELQQLSACFVLPVEDDMASIFDAVKAAALIHQSGGGTGYSFSRLRPEGDIVKSTGGIASGPISFMRVFNASTEIIRQGGRRRGANMGVLRVDHPDILKFINCKEKEGELSNFNISVALTDAFMDAVSQNGDYALINPRTGKETEKINARLIFNQIVDHAWQNGEPGIIFIDRVNKDNPTPHVGPIESTNPCAEMPLLPYESCNLGSINLAHFIKKEADFSFSFDYEGFSETITIAVRFLDNVIDANQYPLPEIREMTLANRKIGLGVMGFADLLYQLELPYDSEEAISLAEKIMGFVQREARQVSAKLAEERGPFPNFQGSTLDRPGLPPIRNATVTTIAPTGSISIIANCSSGIEPVFALSFTKNVLEGEQLVEVNPVFRQKALEWGLLTGDPISDHQFLQGVTKNGGRLRGLPEIPEDLQRIFVTAPEIDASWHVRMQAAFQTHGVDNAVSKTINFSNSATREDIADAFLLAYQLGCKGLTVYRDGSRQFQVLETKSSVKQRRGAIKPRPRPETTKGGTIKNKTGCGSIYITINEDNEGLAEIFVRIGKSGGCAASQAEATGRLISLAFRSGVAVEHIIETLQGIRCPSPAWTEDGTILSCSDAVAKTLAKYTGQGNGVNSESRNINGHNPQCPDCGELLVFKEGCISCPSLSCGYSECS
ncbi:MAG: vitamin B12-dependent ribonucleotide reductase [Candidatus Hodarchaeales archaeon]